MIAPASVGPGNSHKGQIVALRTPGGEEDLLILHLHKLCQGFFCFFYIMFRRHALGVHGGRIAVILAHYLAHQIAHAVVSPGGGGIIQIYFFHKLTS